MSASEELDVALRVARAFEDVGIEYALGGSVATSVQGEPRATNDVDFAVLLGADQVPLLVQRLGPEFSVDEAGLLDAVRRRGSENFFFLPTVTKIDVYVRGGDPFDESELSRRRQVELRPGDRVFVAAPEDNLLRKLRWFQVGGGVSDRQWRDVLGILRVSGPTLDWSYLRDWVAQLGVDDLLERAKLQQP